MKTLALTAGALALSLLGTGCATKKYVAKTIAPVEQRVSGTEAKNTEQDQKLAAENTQIETIDRDLSSTKERLNDTDAKATRAGAAASQADQKAVAAQQTADTAKQAAADSKTFAEQGINKLDQSMQAMNKFHMDKSQTVLFNLDSDKLTADGKAQLDELAKQAVGMNRYVIEVQGFTDKTGDAIYNDNLSQRRAQAVTRYLVNNYDIPVRNVSEVGSGYARPVADDKTRDGRKQNRRVEVRLWVPDSQVTVAAGGGQ